MEALKEDYTADEIKKYLDDLDNLIDTGWFNNPNTKIDEFTFYHKYCKNLKEFILKGREIIRQRLMDKKKS